MGTDCASLAADLTLSFVMRETSCCLCQTIIKPTDIYIYDLLNIDISYL